MEFRRSTCPLAFRFWQAYGDLDVFAIFLYTVILVGLSDKEDILIKITQDGLRKSFFEFPVLQSLPRRCRSCGIQPNKFCDDIDDHKRYVFKFFACSLMRLKDQYGRCAVE